MTELAEWESFYVIVGGGLRDADHRALRRGAAARCARAYALVVARRMRVQKAYSPELEDWLFHVVLPFAAYAALALSAWAASSHLREALFGVGAAAIGLLFIGIHNAWDAVSYHVFVNMRSPQD